MLFCFNGPAVCRINAFANCRGQNLSCSQSSLLGLCLRLQPAVNRHVAEYISFDVSSAPLHTDKSSAEQDIAASSSENAPQGQDQGPCILNPSYKSKRQSSSAMSPRPLY